MGTGVLTLKIGRTWDPDSNEHQVPAQIWALHNLSPMQSANSGSSTLHTSNYRTNLRFSTTSLPSWPPISTPFRNLYGMEESLPNWDLIINAGTLNKPLSTPRCPNYELQTSGTRCVSRRLLGLGVDVAPPSTSLGLAFDSPNYRILLKWHLETPQGSPAH
jgi:hypothetical protein